MRGGWIENDMLQFGYPVLTFSECQTADIAAKVSLHAGKVGEFTALSSTKIVSWQPFVVKNLT